MNLIMWEKSNGYKAKWVAEKIGITPGTYSQIKNGKQDPSNATAEKFNKAFPGENFFELFKNS